jgi:hypothetical protein
MAARVSDELYSLSIVEFKPTDATSTVYPTIDKLKFVGHSRNLPPGTELG